MRCIDGPLLCYSVHAPGEGPRFLARPDGNTMTSEATGRIAAFARNYRLDLGESDLIAAATSLISDYVAVTIAGLSGPVANATPLFSAAGSGPSTAIGTGGGASARDAAMLNGMLAHSLELDDSTLRPIGHPSCTILPALIALGEREGSSGRELIEAYLVGLEVHSRLGQVQSTSWDSEDNWLPIGTIGQVGAAAAAGRLLDLTEGQVAACLAFAAHLAGQLSISIGTTAKAVGAGSAAWTAVQSADLARLGLTGPLLVVERPRGFADVYLGDGTHRFDRLANLGNPHHLLDQGVALKKYPSVYACQWPNDALRQVLADNDLAPEQIRLIELLRPQAAAFCDCPMPTTVDEARSSFEYNLASIALTGHAGLEAFTEERLGDPAQIGMQRRVTVVDHPAGAAREQTWRYVVRVHTTSGEVLEHWVRYPSGHPRNPFSAKEAGAKFDKCTRGHLEPDAVEELSSVVSTVAARSSLEDLTLLLQSVRQGS